MTDGRRADYALVRFDAHLGPDADGLELPWATFAGNETDAQTISVSTPEPADAYVQLQAYEVGTYGHEILVNGDPLPGFDLPPADGWQLWMDAIADGTLQAGDNELAIRRDVTTADSFAVATAAVHWRAPTGDPE